MARDPYRFFRIEARELIDQLGHGLIELEQAGAGGELVPKLLRLAHTLKGAARVVRLPEIADHAHAMETLLGPLRDAEVPVSDGVIPTLLAELDAISRDAAALEAPSTPPTAAPATGPAESPVGQNEEAVTWVGSADSHQIDALLRDVGEVHSRLAALDQLALVAAGAARIAEDVATGVRGAIDPATTGNLLDATEGLTRLARDIARGVSDAHHHINREMLQLGQGLEELRMVPAGALFASCERAARDSAQVLGKRVRFTSQGADVRLAGETVHVLQNALVQLVRNAVAHGIEPVEGRRAAAKPEAGNVALSVLRRGSEVAFACADDGRGIDIPALRDAARRRGRTIAAAGELQGVALADLLLNGGVSTSAALSEVAGRGIGMDIVRDAVVRLHARFEVTTGPAGTRFEIVVPQSIAQTRALEVETGGMTATIPLHAVRRIVRLPATELQMLPDGPAVPVDGATLPAAGLGDLLRRPPSRPAVNHSAIILGTNGEDAVALLVDRVVGTTSILYRPLPDLAPVDPVVSGASLRPDGSPLLMLDPEGLIAAIRSGTGQIPSTRGPQRPLLVIDDSLTTRMLEQSILESAGYEVDLAVSAEDGLELARKGDYALILVDVEMPGMDGFTFVETIRSDEKLHATPAILVTSRNAPEDLRRGREAGAQGYVVKSEFDQSELLAHIARLVN